MSHFTVMVIGENPEEQLAPFSEHIEVPEYKKEDVSDEDMNRMMDYYRKEGHEFSDFAECNRLFGEEWNGGRYKQDESGAWGYYSTYNPKSKWDWYVLGGRWSGACPGAG